MSQPRRRFSEPFKREAVARMTADPNQITALARELGVSRSLLYAWRKQFASPHPDGEGTGVTATFEGQSPGVRAASDAPKGDVAVPSDTPLQVGEGPGMRLSGEPPRSEVAAAGNPRLRLALLETAFALALAIRETTGSAPLNQLSSALGLVIDRLLRLEALAPSAERPAHEEVIRIEYLDSDSSVHQTPPWARDDPAFKDPVSRGHVRSPFWENGDGQADDSGDGSARG